MPHQLQFFLMRNKVCQELGASLEVALSIPRQMENEKDVREFVKASETRTIWRAMKLVVLGSARVGKTTLLNALKGTVEPGSQKVFV